MSRTLLQALLLLIMLPVRSDLVGQSGSSLGDALPVKDPAQGAWDAVLLQKSAAYWRSAQAADRTEEAFNLYNLFRSERNLALQKGKGQLDPADRQRLEAIADDLLKVGQSPEVDLARFHLDMPAPSEATLLVLAQHAELDPRRSDLLGPLLTGAVLHRDVRQCTVWAQRMRQGGAIATPLLDMADDILLSVGPGGVLFTAGEMDSHALWVRQYADGMRPDVLVLDMRLLENPDYRALSWQLLGGKGRTPAGAMEFLRRSTSMALDRPIHLSLSLGSDRLAVFKDHGYLSGLTMQYSRVPLDNVRQLEQHWAVMRKPPDAGPLSRNYLVAGSVLLKHYRSVGDETGVARMEYELRQLATRMNATDQLYRLDILEH